MHVAQFLTFGCHLRTGVCTKTKARKEKEKGVVSCDTFFPAMWWSMMGLAQETTGAIRHHKGHWDACAVLSRQRSPYATRPRSRG
jgi:hypothetical protein